MTHYVDSEVGRLGTVLLHRPGRELARLTPRNNDSLLFDGIPWVGRAQEEHDAFAAALRAAASRCSTSPQLLAETLARRRGARRADRRRARRPPARRHAAPAGRRPPRRTSTRSALAGVLIAGLAHEELRTSWERPGGLVYALMDRHDFVIDPLPNLLFTRDSSVWIRDRAAVTSLAMPARRRETTLTDAIYRHHPRFAGTRVRLRRRRWSPSRAATCCCSPPGVLAVGVGRADHAGRRRAAGPAVLRARRWRTPSWWCRSRRSGRPCTSTPSARWSTSTPSSCTRTSPTRWWRTR